MSKAILFLRVSTEQQSTDSQKDALTHYAMADGFQSDDIIYIEKKESGYLLDETEREGITELYKAMENPEVSDVYIWELSRLSRRPKDLYSIREKFLKRKIQLHCQEPAFTLLNRDRTGYDSNANLLFSLFGAMAEQEVIEKKARFARGKKRLAEQGRYNGGAIPYGYKKDPSRGNLIVIDEDEEAPIVREIYNLYENGMSQTAIAKEMFARGLKGRAARKTKAFTISLVSQILTNELLTGKPHKSVGSSYVRTYPQIITPEQFARCREIAKKNNKALAKSTTYIHYAHGLIKCTECGRNFVGSGCKGEYQCVDAYNMYKEYDGYYGIPRCSNRTCVSSNIVDSILWELAKRFEGTFILNSAQQELSECEQKKTEFQQKLNAIPSLMADIDEKQQRYLDALAEGWDKDRYNLKKRALDEERRKILANEAFYQEQIVHYDQLAKEINSSMHLSNFFSTDESIDDFVDYAWRVGDELDKITDDNERSRIVHKHIEKVTVEKTTIMHKFPSFPEPRLTDARKIIVYPYLAKPVTLIYIPNNKKGGLVLQKNEGPSNFSFGSIIKVDIPEYSPFPFEYLHRTIDPARKKRQEKRKARNRALAQERDKKWRDKGYITMNEMKEISGLRDNVIWDAIHKGKIHGEKDSVKWWVKKDDFECFLSIYVPKKSKMYHIKEKTT